MRGEVEEYIWCPICQRIKAPHRQPNKLLQAMPIPKEPWDIISMDFVMHLPPLQGHNTILVVVDYLTKQAHFVAMKPPITSHATTKVFFKYVFKYHGLSLTIVSDHDPRFTSDFLQDSPAHGHGTKNVFLTPS